MLGSVYRTEIKTASKKHEAKLKMKSLQKVFLLIKYKNEDMFFCIFIIESNSNKGNNLIIINSPMKLDEGRK